jgi:hypothetical protein
MVDETNVREGIAEKSGKRKGGKEPEAGRKKSKKQVNDDNDDEDDDDDDDDANAEWLKNARARRVATQGSSTRKRFDILEEWPNMSDSEKEDLTG